MLPVWLLLAPRDYLSTFLKIGAIVLLAIGVVVASSDLQNQDGHAVRLHRYRPGVVRQPVPVPVHHHCLRLGIRLSCADRLGHPRS